MEKEECDQKIKLLEGRLKVVSEEKARGRRGSAWRFCHRHHLSRRARLNLNLSPNQSVGVRVFVIIASRFQEVEDTQL